VPWFSLDAAEGVEDEGWEEAGVAGADAFPCAIGKDFALALEAG